MAEKASPEVLVELEKLLNSAAEGLKLSGAKKMFGCHALWTKENVFALVWKHGRIGVKLPDESEYEALMSKKGAEPWKAGPMKMAHWVLVPEGFHKKPAELAKWVEKAHRLCGALPAKKKAKK